MASSTPKSLLAVATLAGLCGLSVGGEVLDRRRAESGPTPAALEAAVAEIRAGWEPGDAVRVFPHWWEDPWRSLSGIGEGTNAHPYPSLLSGPRADPLALQAHARIWVLAAWGHPPEDAPLVAGLGPPQHRSEPEPGVMLARYDLGPPAIIYRATEHLESLEVERRTSTGDIRPCPRTGEVFRCGLERWMDVNLAHRDVGGHHVRWLYAHPGPGAETLSLRWNRPPAGRWVLMRIGHTQAAVRQDAGEPVRVVLKRDGSEILLETTLGLHDYVLREWKVALGHQPPESLVVELSSPDPKWREVMLELVILPQEFSRTGAEAKD